jgi:hypothetical protein
MAAVFDTRQQRNSAMHQAAAIQTCRVSEGSTGAGMCPSAKQACAVCTYSYVIHAARTSLVEPVTMAQGPGALVRSSHAAT